jgi:hypothetical protein
MGAAVRDATRGKYFEVCAVSSRRVRKGPWASADVGLTPISEKPLVSNRHAATAEADPSLRRGGAGLGRGADDRRLLPFFRL